MSEWPKKQWEFEISFYGKDHHREFTETSKTKPMTLPEFEVVLKKRLGSIKHKGAFGVVVLTRGYYAPRAKKDSHESKRVK